MVRERAKGATPPAARGRDGTAVPPAGPSVAGVRREFGVSRRAFARLIGFSDRALAHGEGGARPDEPGPRRIRETERSRERLAEEVRAEDVPQWLGTPNGAFGGLKPLEVIARGETDRLWNMIFYLEPGVAT